ncbi:MAG TPA: right-handed parallel beta-helix repeat-containing protein, partial [Thermomicrobiales bacterium]|nr:right-handed parallel beta-helix repeat-containing protein [Thermomicrobiales bacterium]
REAVVTDNALGDYDQITVDHVSIQHVYRRGIDLVTTSTGHGVGNQITNNSFDDVGNNVATTSGGYAIVLLQEDATVALNAITNSGAGIAANYLTGTTRAPLVTVQGNTIANVTIGMELSGLADGSLIGGATAGDGNAITPNLDSTGILVEYASGTVTLQNNVINASGTGAGVVLYHNEDPAKPVRVLDNALVAVGSTSAAAGEGAGIFMTDDGAPFGDEDGASYATIQGNSITGFAVGIDFERNEAPAAPAHPMYALIGGLGAGEANTITGGETGIRAFDSEPGSGVATIDMIGDFVHDNTGVGVDVAGGAATLKANTISGNQTGVSVGAGGNLGAASQPTSQNFINGNDVGIRIASGAGAIGPIFENDLSGNTTAALVNNGAALVDASGDWWGDNTESGVTGAISGAGVDFSPWLDGGADQDATATGIGFQGDFSSLTVDHLSPQTSGTAIQEGVNLSTPGGTVHVLANAAAGDYHGNVTIDHDLTLAGQGGPVLTGSGAGSGTGMTIVSPAGAVTV